MIIGLSSVNSSLQHDDLIAIFVDGVMQLLGLLLQVVDLILLLRNNDVFFS